MRTLEDRPHEVALGVLMAVELRRLLRRPAVLVLVGAMVLTVALLGYGAVWLVTQAVEGDAVLTAEVAARQHSLLPAGLDVGLPAASLQGLGPALACLLGALVAGSDYRWRTWRVVLVRGHSRARLVAARLTTVWLGGAVLALAASVSAVGASVVLALSAGAPVRLPHLGGFAAAIAVVCLALGFWAVAGAAASIVTRSVAGGVVAALCVLLVEPALVSLAKAEGFAGLLVGALPGAQVAVLTSALSTSWDAEATRAAAALLLATPLLASVAGSVFARQDLSA